MSIASDSPSLLKLPARIEVHRRRDLFGDARQLGESLMNLVIAIENGERESEHVHVDRE